MDAEDGVGRGRQLLHALHQPDDEAVLLVGVQARHAAHVHLEGVHAWREYRGSSSICCCSRREKWGIMSTRDSWDTSRRRRSITGR